jgi:hypothetical protein
MTCNNTVFMWCLRGVPVLAEGHGTRSVPSAVGDQSINQKAQPAMLAGQLTLTPYHVTPESRRE